MGMPALYDLQTMLAVVEQLKSAPRFYLSLYTDQINFEDDWIYWDRVYKDNRKLAPFVAPNVAGRPQALSGYDSVRFKPAYSKQKDQVDYTVAITRRAGEAFGGELTMEQRYDAVKVQLINDQREKLLNTFNWLSARALIDGKVVIKGEDYPEVTVDFQRNANLTTVLTGAAMWSDPASDPLADIKESRIEAQGQSGAQISRLIFGANAWDLFTQRVDLKDLMDKNYGGVQIGGVTRINSLTDGYMDGIEYMGTISGVTGQGRIEAWVDTTRYIDPVSGAETFYLDQNTVVGYSPSFGGVRCFGAIKDKRAGFRPMEMFYKNWEQEDPSMEYMLTQSAPLMVPREPNATYSIKVA